MLLNFTGKPTASYYSQSHQAEYYDDLCWETLIGQEISKLITTDLVVTVVAVLFIDLFRGLFVRYLNPWWFWNMEKTFPEYGEFKVAENILHLVNNQSLMWLGVFFVPMLPMINNIKLIILMYIRGWAVMTCNMPSRQIFRASRSSNFYLLLLLFMLFVSTIPFGYVMASQRPSKACGPFSNRNTFYEILEDVVRNNLPKPIVEALGMVISPGIVIPLFILLILVIYFLLTFVSGLRQANHDLTKQLVHERTEEKKKIFELAGRRNRGSKQVPPIVFHKSSPRRDKKQSISPLKKVESASDEETSSSSERRRHRGPISKSSVNKNHFIPSLGSVNEVEDNSDNDNPNQQLLLERRLTNSDVIPPVKLSLWNKFLVCIGWEAEENLKEKQIRKRLGLLQERQESVESRPLDSDHKIEDEELTTDSEASEDETTKPSTDNDHSSFITDEQDYSESAQSQSRSSDWQSAKDGSGSRTPKKSTSMSRKHSSKSASKFLEIPVVTTPKRHSANLDVPQRKSGSPFERDINSEISPLSAYEKARQKAATAKRHSSSATRDLPLSELPLSVRRGRGRPEEVEVLIPAMEPNYGIDFIERSDRVQKWRTRKN
uniref:TMC domain-containing protein n=1 Tax=Panagrolaimus superbus TaxID=310955 RepID=A0A914Y113_9BILA